MVVGRFKGGIRINNGTFRSAAGIDIGGTKMMLYLSDGDGVIAEKRKLPMPSYPSPEQLFSSIAVQLQESMDRLGWDRSSLAGIGIGLPGVVDSRSGLADNCTALGWGQVDVRAEMRKRIDCPVYVDNDVKLAAVGEGWRGAAKGVEDFVMLAVGTGIGCAIVSGGKLVRGSGFASGEIGYFLQNDDFPKDYGQDYSTFGSLESVASGTAITARAREALDLLQQPTLLRDRFGATPETVRAEQVFQAAAEGDELAMKVLCLPLRHLSIAIANVASLLNPEIVVVGGGVAESGPLFLKALQQQAEKLSPNPVKLVPAELGNEAGAAGALYTALQSRSD